MKYLSLFSGAGGFEIGIERAYEQNKSVASVQRQDATTSRRQETKHGSGVDNQLSEQQGNHSPEHSAPPTCVGYSEIDKYAIQTYQKNFPNHTNYGDISQIKTEALPDFDLLVGGSPCQDLSIAGKRAGLDGERSGLFEHYVRILEAKKPRYFIWENVKGTLSSNKGWDAIGVISAFTEAGYDCQWQVLNAKDFGVPQNRERIFVVGSRGEPRPQVFPFVGSGITTTERSNAKILHENIGGNLALRDTATALRHGASANYQTIVQLNNPTHSNDRVYGTDGISPTLNTMQGGRRQPFIRTRSTQPYREKEIAPPLRLGDKQEVRIVDGAQIRRLTPLEAERLMSWPDGHTDGVSDTQRYKQCGNGVVSNVVEAIVRRMI